MNLTNILLRHNYLPMPVHSDGKASQEDLATVLMNLSHYGYALSQEGYRILTALTHQEMSEWWPEIEKELKSITGEDRNIGDFVVYKNFPAEVMDKTEAEYWIPQILMYWGFPKELFTEEVKPRDKMTEAPRCTVLRLAKRDTPKNLLQNLLAAPARWKEQELKDVLDLAEDLPVDFSRLGFKENLVKLVVTMMANHRKIAISTATDVLRLGAGLSDGDVALREKFKFKSFKKPMRRFLLEMLERCSNLADDVARRPELWKRFLHNLHAGDYKTRFPKVLAVMDDLYHDRLTTYNSKVEQGLRLKQSDVLSVLASRPGEFRRRLVHTLDVFGNQAAEAFLSVSDKLTVAQAVTLRTHLENANLRNNRVFPPKGNWTRMQIGSPRKVDSDLVVKLIAGLNKVLAARVPSVKVLDPDTKNIKLPNNDGEVSPYARGTSFPIPPEIKFIRTASYWKNDPHKGVTWFDNGWNFYQDGWGSVGSCCWSAVKLSKGAIFSGDPVNSKEMKGRAAQLIDLYPDELVRMGVRYCVWNILCYSNIPFDQAEEVYAALQWGEEPTKGKLFEPSRCQLSFPLKGKSKTKYICLLDLKTRQMIYLDANLPGAVNSANSNQVKLGTLMPPFLEYIDSLPSVHDLFRESVNAKASTQILYSDKNAELRDLNTPAYVFRPENKESKYKPLDLNGILI